MRKVEWYTDFVDYSYRPKKTDLVCLFRFEPSKGISIKEAGGRIASESSAGTWTTLTALPKRLDKVMATAFDIQGKFVKVAYPIELWDKGNMPQLLSGIAGNIFGMKALDGLRLVDVSFPKEYLRGYKGPGFGIKGVKKIFGAKNRPVTGAVPKPKIGWTAAEQAKIGYETWMGGFDLLKDDENLTTTPFNRFEDRIRLARKMRNKAERETGDKKSALLNITADTKTMEKRAKMLHDLGWEYAMIDVVVAGMGAVQTMTDVCRDYGLAIHAHRAMHASFDRDPKHGITMMFLAKTMRMLGVDQIHVGTVVGKLVGTKQEILDIQTQITSKKTKELKTGNEMRMLKQDWGKIKPVTPVSSGGLHPGLVPDVLDILGNDICLLVSGGIHGHPSGTRAGAMAAMQAIEAHNRGYTLEEYSKKRKELRQALEKWGHMRPK